MLGAVHHFNGWVKILAAQPLASGGSQLGLRHGRLWLPHARLSSDCFSLSEHCDVPHSQSIVMFNKPMKHRPDSAHCHDVRPCAWVLRCDSVAESMTNWAWLHPAGTNAAVQQQLQCRLSVHVAPVTSPGSLLPSPLGQTYAIKALTSARASRGFLPVATSSTSASAAV